MAKERSLPEYVQSVRDYLKNSQDHELYEISKKLISEDYSIVKMWEAIERAEGDLYDDIHVWAFLERAQTASQRPAYHYLSNAERKDLIEKINADAKRMARNLRVFGLDKNLIYLESKGWHGFYFYYHDIDVYWNHVDHVVG